MMMMPLCREKGGKKHTNGCVALSSMSLSLSLFLAPQTETTTKKERKKTTFFFFFFFFFFSFPPKL